MWNIIKVNNKKTRTFWCFFVKFGDISHLFLMFLLLTLNKEILARYLIHLNWQKQSFRGVLRKRCSENMQQTYKLSINWTRFSAWVFSCKFIAYFQNHFFLRVPLDDCFWIESASLIECLRGRGIRLFLLGNWNSSQSNIYLFKFNNRNTRKRCEICSKLTIKTLERRLEFLLLTYLFLEFLLLTLNK